MNSKKKEITPHKGGRTARFECRINPEIKTILNEIALQKGITPADLIEKWVNKEKGIKKKVDFVRTK